MLSELYVENFALIEKLKTEFRPGLNIITGETGAGKSLLTDAVGMLSGAKGDRDFIRRGTDRALVEGTFTGPFSQGVKDFCAENGIDDDVIVISREMNAEGKNAVRINGRRVNLSLLSRLSPMLMNLHSQTEQFALFKEEEQLKLLDRFGGDALAEAKNRTERAFSVWQEKRKLLIDLVKKSKEGEKRLDYLRYQYDEIEAFRLKEGEAEELREEAKLLSTGAARRGRADEICGLLLGDRESGVIEELFCVRDILERIAADDSAVKPMLESVKDAYYALEDAGREIQGYRDGIDVDADRLEEVEERLSVIRRAEKKYHEDAAGILRYQKELQAEMELYGDMEFHISAAKKEELAARKDFVETAAVLTELRKKEGERLSSAIEEQLHELRLPDARFSVSLYEVPVSAAGRDGVTFMATMNRGEDLKPLSKVASGGEISRVLLGSKIILAETDEVGTMIFDEIDSGLGGETASRVGGKLKLLAGDIQVLAVTHSPLVAAYAGDHFYIEKKEENGRTAVYLTSLDRSGHRAEIARMLSGSAASEISLRQADDLIAAAEQ